ncbi:hypothetical protein A6A06_24040 [Streptomyces sp. CB02923]|uniref:hypothetical protein n=1 Tax=Streptomyces sp. CB02923 TaxID=1718985 RepID=UPI00093C3112|nr:hypothetical protein [Streptomyces sp. CB02923]OKI00224.1 hypothetical protein A6A06_24040 [Streptomyces sp. CB02923]
MENPAHALLPASEFLAVKETITVGNRGMPRLTAERILVQALAFVATAARYRNAAIAPSRVVDEGWHALPIGPTPQPGPMPRNPGQSLPRADGQELLRGVDRPAL